MSVVFASRRVREVEEASTWGATSTEALSRRVPVLTDRMSVAWWTVEILKEGHPGLDQGTRIGTTLQPGGERSAISIQEYVEDRVGWVSAFGPGFTDVRTPTGDSSLEPEPSRGEHVVTELMKVAGRVVKVDAYRHEEHHGTPTKKTGEMIRQQLKDAARSSKVGTGLGVPGARQVVVWIQPKNQDQNAENWLQSCLATVHGFVEGRMHEDDLKWTRVSAWLSVIHTPWATFATWSSEKKYDNVAVPDARVRHLVVDPVVLATSQMAFLTEAVDQISQLSIVDDEESDQKPSEVRDAFFRWRAANWWERPAQSPIVNSVWCGVCSVNNVKTQTEYLAREVSDYAVVEESRHQRKTELHNLRLAWGALVFALLALVMPLAYSEGGLWDSLLWGALVLLGTGAAFAVWWSRRRHRGRISRTGITLE